MAKVKMSRGKFEGISACADEHGVIAAAAMDQRGSLKNAIAKARGPAAQATTEDVQAFKAAVTRVLTKHASAILMDPEYGLGAIKERAPGTGVLLAYEKTGYDTRVKGRLPDLLPEWSVRRLLEAGADAIKILLYYNPFDDEHINAVKHALIERVGADAGGEVAYTRQEAMEHFRTAASAASKPFIYLSAGVSDAVFRETLELAAEAGTAFSGVLCGRATWQDGIPVYAREGVHALENWLEDRGVR